MSTIVQGALTTYASRVKTGNTPLIVPSPSLIARNRSIVTGTPLVPAANVQSRMSFRSNSRMNDDDDDEDEDEEFLDVESDEGKKDKEEDELEETGGFVQGPPPDVLIHRRNALPTKHIYRYTHS
jgi:chromatin structure-remodeling complex subunit SFH1